VCVRELVCVHVYVIPSGVIPNPNSESCFVSGLSSACLTRWTIYIYINMCVYIYNICILIYMCVCVYVVCVCVSVCIYTYHPVYGDP